MTTVGFIGLGEQGKPLAVNVVEAGFDLLVNDVRPEAVAALVARGARAARTARELAAAADVVEVIVVDDRQVEAVVLGDDGVLAGARPGSLLAIHSTVRPSTVRKIGERAMSSGVAVLDVPMSGGPAAAAERKMCYIAGGAADALARCRPVFETSAATIVHTGALGTGMAAKIAHQVVVCVNMLAAHEGFEIARCAGLDLDAFGEVIHAGAAQSRIADRWAQSRPSPSTGALFEKDLMLALELARELGLELSAAILSRGLVGKMLGERPPGRDPQEDTDVRK